MAVTTAEFDAVGMTIFARTDALLLLVDDEQRLVAINAAAGHAVGLDPDDAAGQDASIFSAARHAPEFRRALRDATRGMSSMQEQLLPELASASHRSVAWSISRVRETPCLVVCVGIGVTASRDEREDLRLRAMTDELTGLANRSGLLEHLNTMAGTGATVVFCDLDGFKSVNDKLGHAAGDAVLVQTARRLTRTVRGEDFVARIGGDEFVIVVPPDADASFEGLARRLLRAIGQPMVLPGAVAATVGMSVGHATLEPGRDPAEALMAADKDMYAMKSRQDMHAMKSRQPTRTTVDGG